MALAVALLAERPAAVAPFARSLRLEILKHFCSSLCGLLRIVVVTIDALTHFWVARHALFEADAVAE